MLLHRVVQRLVIATEPLAGDLTIWIDHVFAGRRHGKDLLAARGVVDHFHQAIRIQRGAIWCVETFLHQRLSHVIRRQAFARLADNRTADTLHLPHGRNVDLATQVFRT